MTKKDIKERRDSTLERNTIKHWKFLIDEYLLIKNKKHPRFCFVQEFYDFHKIKRQNFIKYYNRYKLALLNNCNIEEIEESLLPQKRGPKYINNRTKVNEEIINKIKELRINNGMNRYNIKKELEMMYCSNISVNTINTINSINTNNITNNNNTNTIIDKVPSSSTIYNILKKNNLNKLNNEMTGNSRKDVQRIIKEKVGELGHIDCHYLPKNIIKDNFKDRYYLIGLIDDKSRIISLELSKDIQSLTVMFKTLNMINFLRNIYNIEFKSIMTDNGPEFGCGKEKNNKDTNPFERLLKELNIKHIYTKPYKPQTNGKIERLWKTINDELLNDMVFDNEQHLKEELIKYAIYFNEYRSHTSLNGKTPKDVLKEENLSSN